MEPNEFGVFFKARRKALGLTAKTVAQRYGCSPAYIFGFETGQQTASRHTAEKLLDAMRVEWIKTGPRSLTLFEDGTVLTFKSSQNGQKREPIELVDMVNGKSVPKACVDALDEFEKTWPGASFSKARAAIVFEVLQAYKREMNDV